jgi:hypothetical protein
MVGRYIGGVIQDLFGGFAGLFQGNAVVMLLIVVLAAAMRPPHAKLT